MRNKHIDRIVFLCISFIIIFCIFCFLFVNESENTIEKYEETVENIVMQEYYIDETTALFINYSDMFINSESIDDIFTDKDTCYFAGNSLYVIYEQGVYEVLKVLDGCIIVNEPLFEELDSIVLEDPMAYFIMALEGVCSNQYRVDDIIMGLVRNSPCISTVIYNLSV